MPAPLADLSTKHFVENSSKDSRELVPPVSSQMKRTWPDVTSPRLSAPGSVAGSKTTLNASCFPSIPPLQRSSAFFWATVHRRQPSMPRCPGQVQLSLGCTRLVETRKRHRKDRSEEH